MQEPPILPESKERKDNHMQMAAIGVVLLILFVLFMLGY